MDNNVIIFPKPHALDDEKGHILAALHSSIQDLQKFIVKHGVDVLDELDVRFIEDDKNALEVTYETARRK